MDEAYTKAKKYIYQNPQRASFADIIKNTEISEKALSRLMSQGKINLGGKKGSGMKCRVCGKEAEDGVLCNRCREKLRSEKFFSQSSGTARETNKKEGSGILPLNQK
ncbi:MAG: hypothetical protein EOM54_02320 [Clostridia bacterium]|nr:hypothetical protein [Clostridia bacterium]